MAHDVFISYSSKDRNAANAVCAVLERNGIRCWIAPRDVTPGMVWGTAIVEAINQAKVMVLVFSGAANASPQIEREVERSISKGLPIIPFRIEDVQPSDSLELFISASHWLDAFTEPLEDHLERLAVVVRQIIGATPGKEGDVRQRTARVASAVPERGAQPAARSPPIEHAAVPSASGSRWPLTLVGFAVACLVLAGAWLLWKPATAWLAASRHPREASRASDHPAERANDRTGSSSIGCNEEKHLRSLGTTTPTSIVFTNKMHEIRRLYWLNHAGARVHYASLAPGQTVTQRTYVSHPWVVTNEHDECRAIYMPTATPQDVALVR